MKSKIIIGVIILVLAGLFATGILDWRRWSSKARQTAYQVQNIANEKTPGIGSDKIISAKTCRENLQRIESAKRAIAEKGGGKVTGSVTWDQVLQQMGTKERPVCPEGGEYTLGELGATPRCSKGGQGTQDASDDHIIKNF